MLEDFILRQAWVRLYPIDFALNARAASGTSDLKCSEIY